MTRTQTARMFLPSRCHPCPLLELSANNAEGRISFLTAGLTTGCSGLGAAAVAVRENLVSACSTGVSACSTGVSACSTGVSACSTKGYQ